ncbi:BTAD domain-containing putative transcriptional regulator [Lentzea sp. DG1S-22]|uniref:BTAD domain-containing putative transcriptional regulator n=1 Tax=Lentzea sp. DG1S-22 TaxID=3108822 RepID=UPI002E77649B|nr:BTAD domain-containing putative transcriptional regulator [Lentzea sp. DG1S-22]WVH82385.1 BTAD domain-containing putative transcriptional regulator [Lentzea sp. DG1S-22]
MQLIGDDGRPRVVSAPKRRAVLAVLGFHLNTAVSFDQLVRAVWEDHPPANAKTSLQTHIWALRKLLDPSLSLQTREPGYVLTGPADATDHARFLDLVRRSRGMDDEEAVLTLGAALELWRGEPLSDVGRTEPLDALGQELEDTRLGVVEDLAHRLLRLRRPTEALSLLTADAARHPFRESLVRLLMIAYSHSGQQARAITTYHKVREQLSTELGVDPSPLLRAAFESILRGEDAPGAAVAHVEPSPVTVARLESGHLVGRQEELGVLTSFLRELQAGRGGVVSMCGEAGVGKSALIAELLGAARDSGVRVCAGVAERAERDLPLMAATAALGFNHVSDEPDVVELMRMLRGQSTTTARFTSHREVEVAVTRMIIAVVEKWCVRSPVLVVVEDLQWADSSSLLLLHLLGRAACLMPLGVVVTARTGVLPDHVQELLQGMANRPGAIRLDIAPLSEEAIVGLAERKFGALPGERLRKLLAGAAGNPLYALELLRGLKPSQKVRSGDGVVDLVGPAEYSLPPSLLSVVDQHLRLLSAQARGVLEVAAVLGCGCALAELSAMSALPEPVFAASITEAVVAGVLSETSAGHVGFRHDVLRQAVLESKPAPLVGAVQHRAAHLLRELGRPVERITAHLAASPLLDRECAQWLSRAAREVITRAPSTAIDLFGRAREVAGLDQDLRRQLTREYASALLWSGRLEEAAATARALMAEESDPQQRAELRYLLARTSLYSGHPQETLRQAEAALAERVPDKGAKRSLQCMQAVALNSLLLIDHARSLAESVLADAVEDSDAGTVVQLMHLLGAIELVAGDRERAITHFRAGIAALADTQTEPFTAVTLYVTKAAAELDLDRPDDARSTLVAGLSAAEVGTGAAPAWYHTVAAQHRFRVGQWDDALTDVAVAVDVVQYDDEFNVTRSAKGLEVIVLARRGSLAEARARHEVIEPAAPGRVNMFGYWVEWAGAVLLDADGQPGEAVERLVSLVCTGEMPKPHLSVVIPDLVRLALASGKREVLSAVARETADWERRTPAPGLTAALALLAAIPSGDPAGCERAAELYRQAGNVLAAALCDEIAAGLFSAGGRDDAATTAVGRALAGYAVLGAKWDEQRARTAVDVVPRVPEEPAQQVPLELTESEWQVARCAAWGMTNSEIGARLGMASPVVERHLESVMRKGGVSSRFDIAERLLAG